MSSIKLYSPFLIFLFLLCFISCSDSSFKKTKSGLKYRFIKDENGASFKNGDFVFLHLDYYDENDSLLYTYQTKNIPVTLQYIDSIWDNKGQLYEGMKLMNVGDSAVFRVNCANLYELSFNGNIPYGLDPFSEITVYVGVLKSLSKDHFNLWRAELIQKKKAETDLLIEQQLYEDIEIIDQYAQETGFIPMELESGIRYTVQKEKGGYSPLKGDIVRLFYTGRLLDGTLFDSSENDSDPFEYEVGSSKVIKGLNEGIMEMSPGDVYTFYIPSTLGYGNRSYKKIIQPNSILVYEVKLLDIIKKED